MKKALLAIVVVLVAAIGGGIWWLHGNLDGLLKSAIEDYGSKMKQAKVSVGSVELKAADGKGAIRGLVVGRTVSVPLPDIALRDIGKAKGGVTPGDLGNAIAEAMKQRLSNAISFDRLMKSAGQALQDAGSAIKDLFK